ncbi:MAG: NAD(P)-dependent oxidoreductase [Hyphomicrobiales bacterium]|nr:NAD(P)-dependent oxidoreductase [Hyphomicrobiales bacterium]
MSGDGMSIGFVGLGAMGGRMAGVLVGAGHRVTGYDRVPAALAALEANGGKAAPGLAEACAGADALVLMVVNADQAQAVLFDGGALDALPEGALVLSCVTMPADAAQMIGERTENAGRLFLDAPVSGGTPGAEKGSLTFMVAGSDAAYEKAAPLLEAMGRNIFRLGDTPGAGSTMKMVHQLAAGCNLAVAAEVMSMGAHLGLDPAQVLEVLNVSAGGSWMIADRGPRMLTDGADAKSAVDIFVKDLGIVLDAARAAKFPVPVSAAALQVFLGASSAGFGGHDDSQSTRFYEELGARKVRKSED